MNVNSVNQVSFKALYVKDNRFNERERQIADDISEKLLGKSKPNDTKNRTWNEWLKKEKGIDVCVKRTPDTSDMLTVFGVKNVKDFDALEKMKDFFIVGNYHTMDFEPTDVMDAYKAEKRAKALSIGVFCVLDYLQLVCF